MKGTWPANSPDLSPIENLWSILKNDLDSMGGLKDLKMLETQLKTAWSNISPEILGNLIDGMPNRIKKCINSKADILANNCSYIPIIFKVILNCITRHQL